MLTACNDDVASAGASALLEEESVVVFADTLRNVRSEIFMASPIEYTPDSFLLGECARPNVGTIKADILAQFTSPEGFVYPDSAQVDSITLMMFYRSWHGDGNAPIGITVYEMDKETLYFDSLYTSDVDVTNFCSLHDSTKVLYQDRIVVPAVPADSIYQSATGMYIYRIMSRLNDRYAQKIFNIKDFSSKEAFNQLFKGLYITTNYGGASALYVYDICLAIHYHYTFPTQEGSSTYTTLPDVKYLYANVESRQINRYVYPERDVIYSQLKSDASKDYILSPANIYTQLNIPINDIKHRIQSEVGDKRPYVNMASLKVNVLNGDVANNQFNKDNWARPASSMMLIKKSAFNRFFTKKELPSDTCAICSNLTVSLDEKKQYQYSYMFDLSDLLTQQQRDTMSLDTLEMLLVPVKLSTAYSSSASYVSAVQVEQAVTSTILSSSSDSEQSMNIEVIYSGFSDSVLW
jgi:hypothetical protein